MWLDWDQPLSAQSAPVAAALEALRAAGRLPQRAAALAEDPSTTGGDVYQSMAAGLGPGRDRDASRMLREAGVPGIRYVDGITRRREGEERVWNYVVFDPADVAVREAFEGPEARPKRHQGANLAPMR